MKKLLTTICFLGAILLSGADLLDETAAIVDILERDYWLSQRSASGDYRNHTEARVKKLVNNINRIQHQLMAKNLGRNADLTGPAMTLSSNYGALRSETIKRFTLRFKTTSMRDYTREFKQLWKEKEAAKNKDDQPAASAKGKKSPPKKRNATPPKPTLANVDLIEYERWLAEICSTNVENFQRVKSNGSRSENNRMSDMVSEYFTAIRKLRVGLAKVRQTTDIEFK